MDQRVQKATRLVADGKVAEERGRIFEVAGDTATYTVFLWAPSNGGGFLCTCPHGMSEERSGPCSHVLAAQHIANETPSIESRLRDALLCLGQGDAGGCRRWVEQALEDLGCEVKV